MDEFKANNADNNQRNGEEPNDMGRISKKNNSRDDGSCSADPCPDGIGRSDRDGLHGLRDREKTQHNENHRDNAGDDLCKSLAVFERDGEADFKKTGQ